VLTLFTSFQSIGLPGYVEEDMEERNRLCELKKKKAVEPSSSSLSSLRLSKVISEYARVDSLAWGMRRVTIETNRTCHIMRKRHDLATYKCIISQQVGPELVNDSVGGKILRCMYILMIFTSKMDFGLFLP
jgi:hypothetical protein